MKSRCFRENHKHYSYYGGRGITVCERWRDSFETFLQDVGVRPSPEHTLDRWPDQNGNYEPGNVRWATRKEQQNNMRSNHFLEIDGKRITISEFAGTEGVSVACILHRLKVGIPLATPYRRGRR